MTELSNQNTRSSFVTAVAWVFIVLAGFATLIAILQNIMIAVMFPAEAMRETENVKDAPAIARFMFSYPLVIFGAFLAVAATTLISAIGLLRRKNWARLIFIGMLSLGTLWNLGGLAVMFFTFSSMPQIPDHAPPNVRSDFDFMWNLMMGFSVVVALVFAGLFGWIIKRLVSLEIKREFLAL
jgi:hypothetical protein